jgi:hypothetical protein
MLIEYQITTTGQCHCLESVPKNAKILCIDGKEFIAKCENCGKPLVEGDKYTTDAESCYFCIPCDNALFEAEKEEADTLGLESPEPEARYVTREIAIDAGDPSLEGQPL